MIKKNNLKRGSQSKGQQNVLVRLSNLAQDIPLPPEPPPPPPLYDAEDFPEEVEEVVTSGSLRNKAIPAVILESPPEISDIVIQPPDPPEEMPMKYLEGLPALELPPPPLALPDDPPIPDHETSLAEHRKKASSVLAKAQKALGQKSLAQKTRRGSKPGAGENINRQDDTKDLSEYIKRLEQE